MNSKNITIVTETVARQQKEWGKKERFDGNDKKDKQNSQKEMK
jgi:hypothetical protein